MVSDKLSEELKPAVVFAILMQNNDGILGKAPSYVMEKWKAVAEMRNPEWLLDAVNLAKLKTWEARWLRK